MQVVQLTRHGGPEVLEAAPDFPVPEPGAGELLIKVAATSINQVDTVIRRGYPGLTLKFPHIPGGDIAGTVADVGAGVAGFKGGERVAVYPIVSCGKCTLCAEGKENLCLDWKYFGMHLPGSYAQYVTVPAANAELLPEGVTMRRAATLPVAGLTAYHALKTVGGLQEGQTAFIWAASGGMGSFAVQIAGCLGARVAAVGNSPAKVKELASLGADLALDRLTDDIPARVADFAPAGVDLVLDPVGPATFDTSFNMLKKGGTLLHCGILTGRETTFSIHMTYLKHLSLKGLYLGTRGEFTELLQLVADGPVKPYIGNSFPLRDAAAAHRLMESGGFVGKILLEMD